MFVAISKSFLIHEFPFDGMFLAPYRTINPLNFSFPQQMHCLAVVQVFLFFIPKIKTGVRIWDELK